MSTVLNNKKLKTENPDSSELYLLGYEIPIDIKKYIYSFLDLGDIPNVLCVNKAQYNDRELIWEAVTLVFLNSLGLDFPSHIGYQERLNSVVNHVFQFNQTKDFPLFFSSLSKLSGQSTEGTFNEKIDDVPLKILLIKVELALSRLEIARGLYGNNVNLNFNFPFEPLNMKLFCLSLIRSGEFALADELPFKYNSKQNLNKHPSHSINQRALLQWSEKFSTWSHDNTKYLEELPNICYWKSSKRFAIRTNLLPPEASLCKKLKTVSLHECPLNISLLKNSALFSLKILPNLTSFPYDPSLTKLTKESLINSLALLQVKEATVSFLDLLIPEFNANKDKFTHYNMIHYYAEGVSLGPSDFEAAKGVAALTGEEDNEELIRKINSLSSILKSTKRNTAQTKFTIKLKH